MKNCGWNKKEQVASVDAADKGRGKVNQVSV